MIKPSVNSATCSAIAGAQLAMIRFRRRTCGLNNCFTLPAAWTHRRSAGHA
jgi:hypothetical protein